MTNRVFSSRLPLVVRSVSLGALSLSILALSSEATAQDAAPEAPPEPAPAAAEPAPAPEEPKPTAAAEPPPPAEKAEAPAAEPPKEAGITDEFVKTFTIGVGMRTGLNMGLSGPTEGQIKLDDGLVDQANIRPFMTGNFTKNIGFFTSFEIGTPSGLGSFAILDAIAQLKFLDELQLWVGQHIPANDRNNMNGPFFGNTWNFALAVEGYPFDVGARDRGATLWGLVGGGVLKYHLSVVDAQPGRDFGKARFAGRVTVHLLEPEDFYYNSGTYFGTKDVLAIGGVFQGQQGDAGADNELIGGSVDAFFEKNLKEAGTFTAELGYWNFDGSGNGYIVNQGTVDATRGIPFPNTYPGESFMGVLSWLTPTKIGIGQLQPNVRVQYGDWAYARNTVVDAGLAYVVDGFSHKYHLNYRHAESEPGGGGASVGSDMIQFGVQYMMSK